MNKNLFVLILVILLGSCSSTDKIYEHRLYNTKKYCGDYIKAEKVDRNYTRIFTTETSFQVYSGTLLIPFPSKCYVKYEKERIVGSLDQSWVLYFTWEGESNLYRLRQNALTGQIPL